MRELLDRNARFAAGDRGELPPLPARGWVVLTCMDHRIDPAAALGLELGEAMVIRNAGARVTPSVIKNLQILDLIASEKGSGLHELELILMQHTECGAGGLGETHAEALAEYLEVPVSELAARSPADPYEGIRVDIETLAAATALPDRLSVTGVVYQTGTGRVELVERRAPLRELA